MSDNMNDKNENIGETVVDEAVVDQTAEAEASETVDDAAIGDIAADESSADSIESIDFTVVYDDDNVVKAAFIVKSYLTEDPTGNNKPCK